MKLTQVISHNPQPRFRPLFAGDLELAQSAPRAVENDLRRDCFAQEGEPLGRFRRRPGIATFLTPKLAARNGQLQLVFLRSLNHRTSPA